MSNVCITRDNFFLFDWNKELKIYRNGNFANFSMTPTIAKIFEELFTPTLNGIAFSVWYVSSTPVV